jgi:hypothetical protein
MDAITSVKYGNVYTALFLALILGALITYISYMWSNSCTGMPSYEGFQAAAGQANAKANGPAAAAAMMANPQGTMAEGFWAGPARGSGVPACLRTSSAAAQVYDILASKKQTTEEGPDDLRELTLILSKISCFKRDLMGAAGVVEATRYQPFSTAHDMEPVAETAARCFAKTIPQRDLELALDKWGGRGTFLIKRLCTSVGLTDAEEEEVLRLFGDAMADVSDVALGRCCSGPVMIAGEGGPRMVGGFEPAALVGLREYKGYY